MNAKIEAGLTIYPTLSRTWLQKYYLALLFTEFINAVLDTSGFQKSGFRKIRSKITMASHLSPSIIHFAPATMPEDARQRNPRPQFPIPTKASLDFMESLKVGKSNTASYSAVLLREDPWKNKQHLGDLTQGQTKWSITVDKGALGLVRRLNSDSGKQQIEQLRLLSHPNIHTIQEAFTHKSEMYICFEYCRFTLEEILHVHLSIDESQIKAVTVPVRFHLRHNSV